VKVWAKTTKNCESKSRIFPNENGVKNSAKVRKPGVGIGGYLTAAEICLLLGQCWAGYIHFWSFYRLALGSQPQIEHEGRITHHRNDPPLTCWRWSRLKAETPCKWLHGGYMNQGPESKKPGEPG
jgi:hypothetical protein